MARDWSHPAAFSIIEAERQAALASNLQRCAGCGNWCRRALSICPTCHPPEPPRMAEGQGLQLEAQP